MSNAYKFAAMIVELLPKDMTDVDRQYWISRPTAIRLALAPFEISFLTSEIFQTRPGFWVSEEFRARIIPAHRDPINHRGIAKIHHFDLENVTYDNQLIGNHRVGGMWNMRRSVFTPDQLDDLIVLQRKGGDGLLLNDGRANIFFMVGVYGEIFIVYVAWDRPSREWRIYALKLHENDFWAPGSRVFTDHLCQ